MRISESRQSTAHVQFLRWASAAILQALLTVCFWIVNGVVRPVRSFASTLQRLLEGRAVGSLQARRNPRARYAGHRLQPHGRRAGPRAAQVAGIPVRARAARETSAPGNLRHPPTQWRRSTGAAQSRSPAQLATSIWRSGRASSSSVGEMAKLPGALIVRAARARTGIPATCAARGPALRPCG